MLVYYFVPFIVSNRYLLFWVSNGHNSVTVQNRTHVFINFFHYKDLGNHLLQLCPKVVKHPVYILWCWRRMEKISWTDHVRNEEVLLKVNEQRNILHEIRKRKANWIGHILRRNCLLKQVIERKIKWQVDEEEDVRSYWMTLRTGEDILIWRGRLWIALCGGIVLEEALDLSSDRILNEWIVILLYFITTYKWQTL